MSYEKVKSVSFKNGKFTITSVSNNVSPKKYEKHTFNGELKDFIRYVFGGIFQITPSANNYYWYFVNRMFVKRMEQVYPSIKPSMLYSLDKDDEKWKRIEEIYKAAIEVTDKVKNDKFILMSNDMYVMGHAFGNSYNLTYDRNKAMRFKRCKADYMQKNYNWKKIIVTQ